MSMPFFVNNDILTFREYLLSESIKPKSTNYGTDIDNNFSNKEWTDFEYGYTFSKINDKYYCILLKQQSDDMAEIAFATSDKSTNNPREYSVSRHDTHNILSVFSQLLYIFLEGIKIYPSIKYIIFESANPALGKAYDKMVKNKWLLETLKEQGFEYEGLLGDFYTFKKSNK